jgi:hypothetical protein
VRADGCGESSVSHRQPQQFDAARGANDGAAAVAFFAVTLSMLGKRRANRYTVMESGTLDRSTTPLCSRKRIFALRKIPSS